MVGKDSLGWQLQKLTLRAQEGIERLFLNGSSPEAAPPSQLSDWLLQSLFWLIALAGASWLSWQLYQILLPYWDSLRPAARLLHQPARTPTDWLRQAQAAQAQADYAAACRALYMASLQILGEQKLIAPQSSRTDGEYLALLRSLALPQPYQLLIQTHERLYFDRLFISAELYAECWQAYQQIERQGSGGSV